MSRLPFTPADQPCSDELWESLRYLSEELTDEQAEAFEARLADNLLAAESLAHAVQLADALVMSQTVPQALASQRLTRRMSGWLRGVATLVASIALVALGWYAGGRVRIQPVADSVGLPLAAVGDDSSVLTVWVALNTRAESPADDAAGESLADLVVDAGVPDWMFAALAAVDEATEPRLPDLDDSDDLLLEDL